MRPMTLQPSKALRRGLTLTAALGALAMASAPAAVAAPCANEAIRAQQGSASLPDCRGWELVSQPDKNSQQLFNASVPTADGNKVAYAIFGGIPGGIAGGNNPYLASRTAGGWQTSNLLPPHEFLLGGVNYLSAATADYSKLAIASEPGLDGGTMAWYSWDKQGNFATLRPVSPADGEMRDDADFAASEDLSHIFAPVKDAYPNDPSHQPGTYNVYDVAREGEPKLASVMPGGDAAPACGADHPIEWGGRPAFEHQVSADGNQIFFSTSGDTCSDPRELYLRDISAEETRLVSGPPLTGDPDNGVESVRDLLMAAPDSSWAIYRTANSLDPADDVDGNSEDLDIYRYESSSETSICLTCAVPGADVLSANTNAQQAEASRDGSHVYFLSDAAYAGAPAAGSGEEHNLYVWRKGSVAYVGRTQAELGGFFFTSQTTPDGEVLAFNSAAAELNGLSGSDNGGLNQVYRYDDAAGSLTCVSCPATQASRESRFFIETDPGGTNATPHYRLMSDDGSILFFRTSQALVREDVNQYLDIYEWHDGAAKLITDGISQDGERAMVSTNASGQDFFFMDSSELVAQAQDATTKLYDARVEGGFPPPVEPPAPCDGEACQGPLQPAPAGLAAASAAFAGPANARPQTHRNKKHKRRHRAKRTQRTHERNANHQRRAGR